MPEKTDKRKKEQNVRRLNFSKNFSQLSNLFSLRMKTGGATAVEVRWSVVDDGDCAAYVASAALSTTGAAESVAGPATKLPGTRPGVPWLVVTTGTLQESKTVAVDAWVNNDNRVSWWATTASSYRVMSFARGNRW